MNPRDLDHIEISDHAWDEGMVPLGIPEGWILGRLYNLNGEVYRDTRFDSWRYDLYVRDTNTTVCFEVDYVPNQGRTAIVTTVFEPDDPHGRYELGDRFVPLNQAKA